MKTKNLILSISIISFLFLGCSKDEEKENEAPTCTITNPINRVEIQQGETVTISVNADDLDGNVVEVKFEIDNVGVSSVNNYPYNYDWNTTSEEKGSHTIKVIAKDNKGDLTTDEILVFIIEKNNEPNHPIANFSVDKTYISPGLIVFYSDNSSNNPSDWLWDFGDGSTSTLQNPSHKYTTTGINTVTLSVSNDIGSDMEIKIDFIEVSTSALETSTVTDYDEYMYKTVKIGSQWWMAENLTVSHFPDGSVIQLITDDVGWSSLSLTEDAYCNTAYGALYTFETATKVCPSGWHLPSHGEWKTLEMYLGMSQEEADGGDLRGTIEGDLLKSKPHNGTDDYGFTAYLGGYRSSLKGDFLNENWFGYWWTSTSYNNTSAYYRFLIYEHSKIGRAGGGKNHGYSVRCVKD